MKNTRFLLLFLALLVPLVFRSQSQNIYHGNWIDLNKNGPMDPYEDPSQPIERRIDDLLSQMTAEEKTAQMATLYGYGRVLKDELPTPAWKQSVWKDGIANIDEHLNGVVNAGVAKSKLSLPFSTHAESINTVQRFFVEQTRLGIPVDFSNEGIRGLTQPLATSFPAPPVPRTCTPSVNF